MQEGRDEGCLRLVVVNKLILMQVILISYFMSLHGVLADFAPSLI
jgi:hypothetical protein